MSKSTPTDTNPAYPINELQDGNNLTSIQQILFSVVTKNQAGNMAELKKNMWNSLALWQEEFNIRWQHLIFNLIHYVHCSVV